MRKAMIIVAASISTMVATPALADDSAMDSAEMVEQALPRSVNAITPAIGNFNIENLDNKSARDFMATSPRSFEHGFRLTTAQSPVESKLSGGLVGLFVPQEFAFGSNAQDTGLDNATPGRYLSASNRSDFLPKSGPAKNDKSSLGIRLGF